MSDEIDYGDVGTRVKKIISEVLHVDPSEINEDNSILENLGAGSIDIVELIGTLEEEFGIEIDDEDVEKLIIIKDAIKYIEERLKG